MRDKSDFVAYVEARSPRLLRTAYLLCRDWAQAEDLLQTALVRVWRAWGRVGEHPDAYVSRVLVNTHLSWRRRFWRRELPTEALPETVVPDDEIGMTDARAVLWAALGRLPPRQRAVLVLRFFEDLPESAVAEILNCSKPLEVAALCPKGNLVKVARPRVIVNGRPTGNWFQQCMTRQGTGMVLGSVSVPTGVEQVTITFDITDWGCVREKGEPCPTRTFLQHADWPLAVYEYTPPARPVEPYPVEAFPSRLGTLKLAGQASGVWPRKSSFTLTVTSPGGYFRIEQLCTGDLADRLFISYKIGDEASPGAWDCGRHRTLNETNAMLWSEKSPKARRSPSRAR